jgi:hypothetical protein
MAFKQALACVLFAFTIPALAQQRGVTATAISVGTGGLITGDVCFTPVNPQTLQPMGFHYGGIGLGAGSGGLVTADPICGTLINGALTGGFALPLPSASSPTPEYKITVTNNGTHRTTLYGYTYLSNLDQAVVGSAWSLDNYIPAGPSAISTLAGTSTTMTEYTISVVNTVGVVNGSNTSFALPSGNASGALFLNGLLQSPGVDYNLNGTTFTEIRAPLAGDTVRAFASTGNNISVAMLTGTPNGTLTAFAVPASSSGSTPSIYENGLELAVGVDYTLSGSTANFTRAPLTGDLLYAILIGS